MEIKKEIIETMLNGTPEQRYFIGENNLFYFGWYYFSDMFTYKPAPFHLDFCQDWIDLENGVIDELMWEGFAESSKTTWAKIGKVHAICYKKKRYINWDSYDGDNSSNALSDIQDFLATNPKLITDFGKLYTKSRKKSNLLSDIDEENKPKSVLNFKTNNGIMLEAYSTQESPRGRVFGKDAYRPDHYTIDDFENNITKESYKITKKVKSHIDEIKRGLGPGGSILYLCNYITEEGSVAEIKERLKSNPRARVREIPVMDPQGTLAWPDKFVKTDEEAAQANRNITNKRSFKVSIESKRRSLGEKQFQTEMMNNPEGSGDYFFDRAIVRSKMRDARDPLKQIGALKVWSEYNPKYSFGAGADTSEGKGLDSSALAIFNFTRRPMLIVATYERNDVIPTLFGRDVKKHCEHYGECIICPETNGIGYSTLATLLELEYPNIYQREVKNKKTGKMMNEYGIRSAINGFGVRWDLYSSFKEGFEDGEFEIWDMDLLKEMYHFKKSDIELRQMEEGMTRHFDKLTAAVIGYEMRKHATPPEEKRKQLFFSKQEDYQP